MNKIIIAVMISFGAGFVFNGFLKKSDINSPSSNTNLVCTDLSSAKSDLISISQNEYLEYTKIKDLKQKYEKADELLGKIMLLFLADVGFKVQKGNFSYNPAEGTSTPQSSIKPESSPLVIERSGLSSPLPAERKSNLFGKSRYIKSLESEKPILDALDNSIIQDPKIESAKSRIINTNHIKLFEGRYYGFVKFLNGKKEDISISWDLNTDHQSKVPTGTFSLILKGPGLNSESSGNGPIDNIKSLTDDSEGFLVDACGGSCYLQLYYNARADQFYGNFYQSDNDSDQKFSRTGRIELKR